MAEEVTLRQVSDAIEAILSDMVPDIPWKTGIMGPAFPKSVTGYICCNGVRYQPFVKEDSESIAEFSLTIISPNPAGDPGNTTLVEDYAMKVRAVLDQEYTLDGWAVDSSVESITFGTPQGISTIGAAVLRFLVKF